MERDGMGQDGTKRSDRVGLGWVVAAWDGMGLGWGGTGWGGMRLDEI